MSNFRARPYQTQALRAISKARANGEKRALVVMASGLGKTVVAGLDVRRVLRQQPNARVLYLCHQNDILKQARDTFEHHILPRRCTHGFVGGSIQDMRQYTVLYATFQTMHLHRRMFRRNEFDYIVVDESHHGPAKTYLPTLKYFRPNFLLGITATPDRMDQQDISDIFGSPVYTLELEDAWAQNLLTPVDYRVMTDEWHNLKVLETPAGKLSVKKLNKTLFARKRDEEIVRIIEEKIFDLPNPRVVIFSPRIDHCEHLAILFPGAVTIHSRMSEREQSERLEAFRRGEIRAVITVDKFNEGIDVPEANVVVFLRSTASRTIFFQQLGRGLRLSEGKKQVLVLDFVANCDRLVILEELRRGIEERSSRKRLVAPDQRIEINTGEFDFDEVARSVLDVLAAIRTNYTKEMLIDYLKKLEEELGRVPFDADIRERSRLGRGPSATVFYNHFGTFNAALVAAGLGIGRVRAYSKEALIKQLQSLAIELGRTPTKADVDKANRQGKCTRSSTFARTFGSFEIAIEIAGVGTSRMGQLALELKSLADQLGHTPSSAEVVANSRAGRGASKGTYIRMFGSLNAALQSAGLTVNRAPYTPDQLLKELRQIAKELGRTPTGGDIVRRSRETKGASKGTYLRFFGTFENALRSAGLK